MAVFLLRVRAFGVHFYRSLSYFRYVSKLVIADGAELIRLGAKFTFVTTLYRYVSLFVTKFCGYRNQCLRHCP